MIVLMNMLSIWISFCVMGWCVFVVVVVFGVLFIFVLFENSLCFMLIVIVWLIV